MLTAFSFSTIALKFKKCWNTSPLCFNETHVVRASSNGFCLCGPHIEWIISKGLQLTWVVWAGNWCLAYFPNWHVSQTFGITSSVPNLGRPPTRFCFSINLKRWRLMWPTHLCQILMSPIPFPCVNNMEFTSSIFTSKVNICLFLFLFAINLPWFFMSSTKHPLGLNVTYKPCSTIWPTETKFSFRQHAWGV